MQTNTVLRATTALFFGISFASSPAAQADTLLPPERIFSGKEAIDVTTGHAAPYVLDFDGDGRKDLLVGEFGDGEFPVAELPDALDAGWKQPGNFANARLRIYRNVGTNQAPRFDGFEYLQAGGGIATIPMT